MCTARRVLVVEDERALRLLLAAALTDEGFTVHVAEHGLAGLQALERFRPCTILLDLRMPVLSGWEFLEQYRTLDGHDSPIIIMTAEYDPQRLSDIEGVVAAIRKPFDLDEVLAITENAARAHVSR